MKKLSPSQLSRVLSQHAVGQLAHRSPGRIDGGIDTGCVAAVALVSTALEEPPEFWDVAYRATKARYVLSATGFKENPMWYPADTDGMLRLLETAGLA